MIMDTHSKMSVEQFVCEYFQITTNMLYGFFYKVYCSDLPLEEVISDFVSKHTSQLLENIQFFHLSRRLNGNDLRKGNNLYDLLLTKTDVSDFLRQHHLEFKMGTDYLQLYHNGKLEELKTASNGNLSYVRWRMGYDKDVDYCFNGFAFRDLLEHNSYYNNLRICPEFINQLSQVLDREEMIWDYHNNSKYYVCEYIVPLEKVIFDEHEYATTNYDKTKILLEAALLRLYKYWSIYDYSFDGDNIILRLNDADTMLESYFVNAEEVQ